MTFFYDLNKKLDSIRAKPETTHKQLNERNMSRAAKGNEKYDESVEEGIGDITKKVGNFAQQAGRAVGGLPGTIARGAKKALDVIAPGDEPLLKKLQKDVGMPQTGKPPMAQSNQVKEKMNPAKAKSFAALAAPKDKITFADKIAGAKKEVDEMLGDVAAEAMKAALSPKQKKIDTNKNGKLDANDFAMLRKGGKKIADASYDDEDDVYAFQDPSKKKTHKTATGGTVTRHGGVTRHQAAPGRYGGFDPDTDPDKDDDKRGEPAGEKRGEPAGEKRRSGRPKGSGKAIGAKGPTGKSKLMTKEADQDSMSDEIKQAMAVLKKAGYKVEKDQKELDEKAVSKNQAVAARIARGVQKGEAEAKPGSASAEMAKMKPKELKKFAKTDTKDLPKKVKAKEEVEETTAETTPKAKGGVQFGKGIYDSMNRDLEQMIAESMNISMSMNTDAQGGPGKTLTVTATDEDAETLAKMLQQAGLGGDQHMEEAYGDVTATDNEPEYPTNTETSNDPFQYAGGINKPKSTGQTTVPVIASQQERQHTYAEAEEDALHRMMEMAGMNQHNRLDEQDIGKKIKLPAAQWLRDPRLETQVVSLMTTGINVTDPAKGFEGGDGNDREYPGKYQFLLTTTAKNPMYFKDFLNMVMKMKKDPNVEVIGRVQAEQPELAEELQRMRELAGLGEAAKPDYIDLDKDGNKKESMKKAAADKDKDKKVEESIFSLTNQWQQYKG